MENRVRMPWKTIAESAYKAAYYASVGKNGFEDEPFLDNFNESPEWFQHAWEAAARQVLDCSTLLLHETPPDERSWEGWTPPSLYGVIVNPPEASVELVGLGFPLSNTLPPPCEPSSSSVTE